jgi:hypothetical protein
MLFVGICNPTYCFRTTLPSLSGYNGNYVETGTYNSNFYYEGDGVQFGVIYYTNTKWCLSSSLGGICLLEGATPCYSNCPDISTNNFNAGPCPTPTPNPANCEVFNFNAYFDCDWEPIPTPSVSIACDDVGFNIESFGLTPTPTPSGNFCVETGLSFDVYLYNSTTPTPTTTPTITLTKTVDVQGQATFVMLDEMFNCVSVKVLVDCTTGDQLYTNNDLLYGNIPITVGTTITVIIGGNVMCMTYSGDNNNISSNCNIDEVVEILSNCADCNIYPTPTPTSIICGSGLIISTTASYTNCCGNIISNRTQNIPLNTIVTFDYTKPYNGITKLFNPETVLCPTPTTTRTPTPTESQVVYVYESCAPINATQIKNTQIIQTVEVTTTTSALSQNGLMATSYSVFKDSQNRCWKYMGQKPINYIPPTNVLPINYTGNYFGTTFIASSIFTSCVNCNYVAPPLSYTWFTNYETYPSSVTNYCTDTGCGANLYTATSTIAPGIQIYQDNALTIPFIGTNYGASGGGWGRLFLSDDCPITGFRNIVQVNGSGQIISNFTC